MNDLLNIHKPTVSGKLYSIGTATSVDFTRLQYTLSAGLGEMSFWREMSEQLKHVEFLMRRAANWRQPIRKARGARGRKRALMAMPT